MKYCIIPDVHGRTFWKKVQKNIDKYDRIIFLGDYVDPYVEYDGITKEEALLNFEEILDFTKENKDKVTLLIGNHDLHYFPDVSEEYGCRRDNQRYNDIQSLFMDNLELFKICEVINTEKYGKVLLSHAGVNKKYYDSYMGGELFNDFDTLNKILGTPYEINKYLWRIGYMRGGYDKAGSVVWSDLDEHSEDGDAEVNKELGVDYQIFAHTYAYPSPDDIYQCKTYAMIDNKQIFEVS